MPDIVVDDKFEEANAKAGKQKKGRKKDGGAEAAPNMPEVPALAENAADKKRKGKDNAGNADGGGKKSHLLLKLLIVAIVIVLVGGFVFEEIYWNFLGVRDWTCDAFVSAAIWLEPSTASVRRRQWLRETGLNEREAEIDAREEMQKSSSDERKAELDVREDSLDLREAELERRDMSLDVREQEMKAAEISKTPVYRRDLGDQELDDLMALSATFAAMTPEAAAEILTRMYDLGDVAAIIYYMTDKSSASILAAMDPAYAANLAQVFLYE